MNNKKGFWNSFPHELVPLNIICKYSIYFGVFVCVAYKLVWQILPWIMSYSVALSYYIGMKIIKVMHNPDSLEQGNCYARLYLSPFIPVYSIEHE
ncbi:hypothetical protein [Selenomonas ruminantium]|uniref:hypothetical protein n=1 Tax=Selenomonas ruminantium TaxID=971 RepID=UPI00115FC8A5|nr:hypothetical protein [Selenomonas ruminantium]